MQATDQAFDNKQNHPATQASQRKHETLAQQGKSDMQAVDDRLAAREQERAARKVDNQGLATNGAGAARGTGHHPAPLP
ncbi:hypothetical protein CIB48_g11690 [Xylaria polymorpha]|nr:hypothetical protein CIB48_g11690 [Xylaria polymorpha]